jgi:antitoxin VapB
MALSRKTDETTKLARELSELTGEDLNVVVTNALRERLARERVRRLPSAELPARLGAMAQRLHAFYDTRPVSRSEWDAASGDGG